MEDPDLIFSMGAAPILQNRVYSDRDEAIAAPRGTLEVRWDHAARMGFNVAFDDSLMVYDDQYDNDVPSPIFEEYLSQVADHLIDTYALREDGSLVVDLGCGDGKVMKLLCERAPQLRAMGIDPAYEGPTSLEDGRITFVPDYFSPDQIAGRTPSLLISRHTLEHIPNPRPFLELVGKSLGELDVPVFFEVPDLGWILRNRAFWDFCYEHCNYFTPEALRLMLGRSGFRDAKVTPAFNDQYLWCEARSGREESAGEMETVEPADTLEHQLSAPRDALAGAIDQIRELSQSGDPVAIWGMATKGVMLSLHLDRAGVGVDHFIDVNVAKQGKFTPINGKKISAPGDHAGTRRQIICMNPNYFEEVVAQARDAAISGAVVSPDFQKTREIPSS